MRLGLSITPSGAVSEFVELVRVAQLQGFDTVWVPQMFDVDALTVIAVAAQQVPGIEFGTGVLPVYSRHPMVLAGHAMTVQSATGNRLSLGLGLSHRVLVEGILGYSFEKPARYMAEYLSILLPLLHEGRVEFHGEVLHAASRDTLDIPGASAPDVLLAALGPRMLKLAGTTTSGTITWMVGPTTLEGHIVPSITAAASAAGRGAPRIIAGLPVCVTSDVDRAYQRAIETYSIYARLPSYRAMLDREGVAPADLAVIGDAATVIARLQAFAEAGATDLNLTCFGTPEEIIETQLVIASIRDPRAVPA